LCIAIVFILYWFYLYSMSLTIFFFFFQAEDGIRDRNVTGVQTCALPISTAYEPDALVPAGRFTKPLAARSRFALQVRTEKRSAVHARRDARWCAHRRADASRKENWNGFYTPWRNHQ